MDVVGPILRYNVTSAKSLVYYFRTWSGLVRQKRTHRKHRTMETTYVVDYRGNRRTTTSRTWGSIVMVHVCGASPVRDGTLMMGPPGHHSSVTITVRDGPGEPGWWMHISSNIAAQYSPSAPPLNVNIDLAGLVLNGAGRGSLGQGGI